MNYEGVVNYWWQYDDNLNLCINTESRDFYIKNNIHMTEKAKFNIVEEIIKCIG